MGMVVAVLLTLWVLQLGLSCMSFSGLSDGRWGVAWTLNYILFSRTHFAAALVPQRANIQSMGGKKDRERKMSERKRISVNVYVDCKVIDKIYRKYKMIAILVLFLFINCASSLELYGWTNSFDCCFLLGGIMDTGCLQFLECFKDVCSVIVTQSSFFLNERGC